MAGEDVLSLIQQFAPANQANVQKLAGAQSDIEQANQEALAAQKRAAELDGIIQAQQNKADLAAQTETQMFEAISGGKVTNPNSLMARLVQDRVAHETARMAQAKKIEQMDSVGFLDNPVAYIQNAFSINGEIDKHNFHAEQSAADTSAITALQHGTQEAAKTALLTSQKMTEATQAAKTEQAAQLLQAATAQLKGKLAGENMHAINALMDGQQQAVQTAYTGLRVKLDLAQEGRAQAAETRAASLAKTQLEAAQEELQAKKDDKEMQQKYVDIVKVGAAKLRLNPDDFSLQGIKLMEKIPAQKPMLDALTRVGLNAATSSVGAGPIGDTPAESLLTIHNVGSGRNFQNAPEAATFNRLQAAKTSALEGVQLSGSDAEQAAQALKLVDAEVSKRVKASTKNAEYRDSFYAAPKLNALVTSIPELKDRLAYATILKPMLDAGVTDITAGSIKAQLDEAIKRGIIPRGRAMVEGARIFSAVATYNNVHGRLYDFGIPTQKGYVVEGGIQPGWLAGSKLRFDLTKPTEFTKWYLYDKIMGISGVLGATPRPLFNSGVSE